MAFEVVTLVTELLRINCNTVECFNYPSEIEALFYILFFPTILVILFVFILSNAIIGKATDDPKGHKGLRFLFAIAIYIFIILQGYFTMVVSLSKGWWMFTILLFGLWVFIGRFIGKGKDGGKGGGLTRGALPGMTGVGQKVYQRITQQEEAILESVKNEVRLMPELKKTNPALVDLKKRELEEQLNTILVANPELAVLKPSLITRIEDLRKKVMRA